MLGSPCANADAARTMNRNADIGSLCFISLQRFRICLNVECSSDWIVNAVRIFNNTWCGARGSSHGPGRRLHKPPARMTSLNAEGIGYRLPRRISRGEQPKGCGLRRWHAALPPADEHLLPLSHLSVVEPVARCLADGPVVQLVGPDRPSAMLVATAAAARAGLQLYVLQGAAIPQSPDEIDELARLWRREAALSPVALSVDVDASGRDAASPPRSSPGLARPRWSGPGRACRPSTRTAWCWISIRPPWPNGAQPGSSTCRQTARPTRARSPPSSHWTPPRSPPPPPIQTRGGGAASSPARISTATPSACNPPWAGATWCWASRNCACCTPSPTRFVTGGRSTRSGGSPRRPLAGSG